MSTATVNVNFKLDADDKRRMELVCKELGLSMSAAFTIFAKKVGREHRIPFELSLDPYYDQDIAQLRQTIADVRSGKQQLVTHDLIEA